MTASNAATYEAQYKEVSAQQKELCDAYQASLEKLDTEDSSQGMITIMTSTLILVGMWQESMMMEEVVTLNALSTMEADENSMQSDFDQYDEEWSEMYDSSYNAAIESGDYTEEEAEEYGEYMADTYMSTTGMATSDLISDAYGYAEDMEAIADLPEFASISDDVTNQVDSIFAVNSDGTLNYDDTVDMWGEADGAANTGGSGSSSSSGADIMQDITNGFSALSTDFSGVSSSAQSEMQYYESEDQQMQGLDETLMKSWATELQSMVNNQVVS